MRLTSIFVTTFLIVSCSSGEKKNDNSSNETKNQESEGITIPEKTLQGDITEPKSSAKEIVSDENTGEKKYRDVTKYLKEETKTETNTEVKVSEENKVTPKEEVKMIKEDFSGVYNQVLTNFVSSTGNVNYAGIKTNRTMLSQATKHFEENPPQSSWSSNQKLAFWINAYNLYTIELVVDNYPVASIKDINGGKPWDKKFINLDGRTLSLNDIENNIIRKDFNEPRIHFAVNCASISCPKLLNKAYTAGNLNTLLESQTKRFINDNAMNALSENSAQISNIFDWYKVDFTKNGSVIDFLNKYANTTINSSAKISYKDYNWNLNK